MITVQDAGTIWMDMFVEQVRQHLGEEALKDAVVYDIGALDGRDAATFKQLIPGAQIYAFEGSERNYKLLAENPDVTSFHQIISDTDKEVEYYEKEDRGISGMLNRGDDRPGYVRKANATSLDSFIEKHNIPSPTLTKLDVEGAAYEVLNGAQKAFKTVKGLHIETEDFPYFKGQMLEQDVFYLLRSMGLECVLQHRNFVDMYGHQSDSVWVKK